MYMSSGYYLLALILLILEGTGDLVHGEYNDD